MSDEWDVEYTLLVERTDGPGIALLDGGLPKVVRRKAERMTSVDVWREDLRRTLGYAAPLLRCLHMKTDREAKRQRAVFVVEGWAEHAWTQPSSLHNLETGLPDDVLERYIAERESGTVPEARSPWARHGWFAGASGWIRSQLGAVESLEQVKNWGISCILKASAGGGDYYFKVSTRRALFADEPGVTLALGEAFPELVPKPVAARRDTGWMLLADFGQTLREAKPEELARLEELVRRYSEMQRATAGGLETLERMGCLDRRTEHLTEELSALTEDELFKDLKPEERQAAEARWPELCALPERLASYGIPPALLHGDLHFGNIAIGKGRLRVFDWTDACVAHPFLDLVMLLDDLKDISGDGVAERLRTVYLEPWQDFAPFKQLLEASRIAEVVGCLHQAVSYKYILAGLEEAARQEFGGATGYWLRRALKLLERS